MAIFLNLILIILSLLGLADASYLTYEKLIGHTPSCGSGFDCGEVLQSSYASIGPIPISALGVIYYLSVLVISIFLYLEIDLMNIFRKKTSSQTRIYSLLKKLNNTNLILLATSTGLLSSLVFVFLMGFVIQAWCLFCLLSALTSTLLFIVSLALHNHYIKNKKRNL